jgi:hypothetical protein
MLVWKGREVLIISVCFIGGFCFFFLFFPGIGIYFFFSILSLGILFLSLQALSFVKCV